MLIAGGVLLVIAVAALLFARHARAQERRAMATETVTCADAASLAAGVAGEVGGGSFRQRCEVVGRAQPGPTGAVKAPESGIEAVWHRTTVTHRYWEMEERHSEGRTTRQRVERSETVSDQSSQTPFVVADATGTVAVGVVDADVDRPEQVLDRFDRAEPGARGAGGAGGIAVSLLDSFLRSGNDSGTLGFEVEEWVIRPGTQLYVQGELSDRTGELSFGKPQDGKGRHYVISTRSEEEIVAGARRNAKIAAATAGVAGVAGVGLLIAGAVA